MPSCSVNQANNLIQYAHCGVFKRPFLRLASFADAHPPRPTALKIISIQHWVTCQVIRSFSSMNRWPCWSSAWTSIAKTICTQFLRRHWPAIERQRPLQKKRPSMPYTKWLTRVSRIGRPNRLPWTLASWWQMIKITRISCMIRSELGFRQGYARWPNVLHIQQHDRRRHDGPHNAFFHRRGICRCTQPT